MNESVDFDELYQFLLAQFDKRSDALDHASELFTMNVINSDTYLTLLDSTEEEFKRLMMEKIIEVMG